MKKLENNVAAVYGDGAVGDAIAKAFARQGARVFLTGRTLSKLDAIAKKILSAEGGGTIETARAAARRMVKQGHGVIVMHTPNTNRITIYPTILIVTLNTYNNRAKETEIKTKTNHPILWKVRQCKIKISPPHYR